MPRNSIDLLWAVNAATAGLLFLPNSINAIVIYSKQKEIALKASQLEELIKSEQKNRSLFENSLAGIVKLSLEIWGVLDSNKGVKQIFGYTNDQEFAIPYIM